MSYHISPADLMICEGIKPSDVYRSIYIIGIVAFCNISLRINKNKWKSVTNRILNSLKRPMTPFEQSGDKSTKLIKMLFKAC